MTICWRSEWHTLVRRALLVTLAVLVARGAAAQAPAPRVNVDLGGSTAALFRSVTLITAAGEAGNRGADIALDKVFGRTAPRGTKPVLMRLTRLWFVNMPIAALTHGAAHDFGHFARVDEWRNGQPHRRSFLRWPWPLPIAITSEGAGDMPADPRAELSIMAGGQQGADELKERLADQIYSRDAVGYFDWVLLGYAALDYPMYAAVDLRASGFRSEDAFFSPTAGDFRHYAFIEQLVRGKTSFDIDGLRTEAASLRRGIWLNLADYSLWSAVTAVAAYIRSGERETHVPALRVRGLRLVPAAYATLGSLGAEKGARVRVLSDAYLATLAIGEVSSPERRLWRVGCSVRSRGRHQFAPEGLVDVFQRPEKVAGVRFEAGARSFLRSGEQPFESHISVGFKSDGYVGSAPARGGWLASLGTTIRF